MGPSKVSDSLLVCDVVLVYGIVHVLKSWTLAAKIVTMHMHAGN